MTKPEVIALIDGDILAYRVGFSCDRDNLDLGTTLTRVRRTLEDHLFFDCRVEECKGYLTGSSNFRHSVFTPDTYKANRKDVKKPAHLKEIKDCLVAEFGFVTSVYCEADDLLAIEATRLGDACVLASDDKDLMMVPGIHYHRTHGRRVVTPTQGLQSFYQQLLTGDRTDNVAPARPKLGTITATKLLQGLDDETSMFAVAAEAFSGDLLRLVKHAHLLWMQTEPRQLWTPPKQRVSAKHYVCDLDPDTGNWQYPSDSFLIERFCC